MAAHHDNPEHEQQSFVLTPQTGRLTATGQGVAVIADAPSRVDINDFGGSVACSWIHESGVIHLLLRDAPPRGTKNEPSVLDVLRQIVAGEIEPGVDSRGEDAKMRNAEGALFTVQIVTVPPEEELNREVSLGLMKRDLTIHEAAGWIHRSIEHKFTVPPATRARVILALDARPMGILSSADVLAEFRRAFLDTPAYGFGQIWLIGPTAARSARLV